MNLTCWFSAISYHIYIYFSESLSPVFFYILYKTIISHYRRNLNTQLLYYYQTYIDLPLKHIKSYSLKYSISTSKFSSFKISVSISEEQFDKHLNM